MPAGRRLEIEEWVPLPTRAPRQTSAAHDMKPGDSVFFDEILMRDAKRSAYAFYHHAKRTIPSSEWSVRKWEDMKGPRNTRRWGYRVWRLS